MSAGSTKRPPIRSIADGWSLFEAAMRRKGASDLELGHMKAAFYTGATTVLDVMAGISEQNVPDDIGATVIEGLHRESRAFAAELLTKMAARLQRGAR